MSPEPRMRRTVKRPALAPHVTDVDWKNTALLRTFITDRGKIRSRRITRISPQQQRAVTRAIKNAREMALLPYTSTSNQTGRPATGDSKTRDSKTKQPKEKS